MSVLGRSALVGIGSVAAPVGIFLILKVTIGLGPASSSAQSPAAEPAAGGPRAGGVAPKVTPEQSRALEWLASLRVDADLPSPLEHPRPVAQAAPAEIPAPRDPLEGLRLSAVLSSDGGDLASINGKVYRAGDAVEGYTVRTIDTREERVELVGTDGRARWLSRNK